jgi:8-oxo-dGTP pyrophosphatase MutT (NUDIX family)
MAESAEAPRRLAAVVIPIFANPPHEVVFVERARHLRRHAGQIAFPGGAVDEEDEGDLARAGTRELYEEIGIPPASITIVGQLDPIRQRTNIFNVTAFIGVVAPGTPLVVDLNEASAAHRVPLAEILAPGAATSGPPSSTTATCTCGASPAKSSPISRTATTCRTPRCAPL